LVKDFAVDLAWKNGMAPRALQTSGGGLKVAA